MSRVLALTRSDLSVEGHVDLVVPLFWASPETLESLERRFRSSVLPLAALIPDISAVLRETYRIAYGIAAGSPSYREVLPLLGFETVLAEPLLPYVVADLLLEELVTRGETGELLVSEAGGWVAALKEAASRGGADFRVRSVRSAQDRPSSQRSRVSAAALDSLAERDWGRLIAQPIEHFGPRFRLRRRLRLSKGGTWCYASYVNYARALARHRVPQAQWLINGRSGAMGVPSGEPRQHLWDMARPAPRRVHDLWVREILSYIESHWPCKAIPDFKSMILATLSEIDLFSAFVDKYSPRDIWVANQWGGEGTLIQVARGAGVPVTQVQHGALEAHFRWADLASDRFLVWGEAWLRGLPEESRERASIVNPDVRLAGQVGNAKEGSRVVFLSAPMIQVLWDPVVARDEAASVLGGVVHAGGKVVARIHPMDATRSWLSGFSAAGVTPERIDKGIPLARSLDHVTAAVTFRSTVFMDCIAAGIPVVALGWYPWVWDDEVREFGAMTLAGSIGQAIDACLTPIDTQPALSPWLAE